MEPLAQAQWLKFPPDIEEAFQRDHFEKTLPATRIACLVAVLIIAVHSVLDYWAMPINYRLAWLIRATVMIPSVVITVLLSFWPGIRKVWQGLVATCNTLIGVGISLMIVAAQPEELAFTIYFSALLLMVIGGFFESQLQFRYAVVSTIVILAVYELCAISSQKLLTYPEGRVLFLFSNFMYTTALLIGGIASYTIEYYRRRDFLHHRELLQRNTELDAYAHTVAHDLKTPLNSVVGHAAVAREYHGDMAAQELEGHLEALATNGMRMASIIDGLLLLASVRQLEDIKTGPLDMAATVDNALTRVENITLESEATIMRPDSWPAALGYGPWIEGVWANLVSNAIKYGGKPPCVELGAEKQPDGMVRLWVRDNGRGLTEEEQGQLFAAFSRLDTERAQGHGLGLSIVQRIVKKLGGQVGIDSAPGKGSTFWFTLPVPD